MCRELEWELDHREWESDHCRDKLADNRRVHLQNIPLVRHYWESYRDKQGHWSLKNSLRTVRKLRRHHLQGWGLLLGGRWAWSRLPNSFLLNKSLSKAHTYYRHPMNICPHHSMSIRHLRSDKGYWCNHSCVDHCIHTNNTYCLFRPNVHCKQTSQALFGRRSIPHLPETVKPSKKQIRL